MRLVRAGLAATALAQLATVFPALIMGNAGLLVPPRASRELGAFNLALAVGFLAASLRSSLARGTLPLVIPAVGLLVVLAGVDSWLGQTTPTRRNSPPHRRRLRGVAVLAGPCHT